MSAPTRILTIVLNHLPAYRAGPNGGMRGNPWPSIQARSEARVEAIALVREQGWFGVPMERASVQVTWSSKSRRRRDADNLLASMKGTFDGLTQAGVWVDDSADRVEYHLRFIQGTEGDGTEIIVEERP